MSMFICYHKPSLFLYQFESFTQKLFLLSRLELNLPFNLTAFNPKQWLANKKQNKYDKSFEKKPDPACKTLKEELSDK